MNIPMISFSQFLREQFSEFDEPTNEPNLRHMCTIAAARVYQSLTQYDQHCKRLTQLLSSVQHEKDRPSSSGDSVARDLAEWRISTGETQSVPIIVTIASLGGMYGPVKKSSPFEDMMAFVTGTKKLYLVMNKGPSTVHVSYVAKFSTSDATPQIMQLVARMKQLADHFTVAYNNLVAISTYVRSNQRKAKAEKKDAVVQGMMGSDDRTEFDVATASTARIPVPSYDAPYASINNPLSIDENQLLNIFGYHLRQQHPEECKAAVAQSKRYYGTINGSGLPELIKQSKVASTTKQWSNAVLALDYVNSLNPTKPVKYVRYVYCPAIIDSSMNEIVFYPYIYYVLSNEDDTLLISSDAVYVECQTQKGGKYFRSRDNVRIAKGKIGQQEIFDHAIKQH